MVGQGDGKVKDEEGRSGRMEGWKGGRREEGRMEEEKREEWKIGRMEEWKAGGGVLYCSR